jgi:hypothetical protein
MDPTSHEFSVDLNFWAVRVAESRRHWMHAGSTVKKHDSGS